jgi:chaperonin GroES
VLKPVGNRILVRRQEADAQTKGGIHIPDTAKKKLFRGTVLAVGPGKFVPNAASPGDRFGTFVPPCPVSWEKDEGTGGFSFEVAVNEGDTVVFGEWSGHEVEDGEDDGVTRPKLVVLEEDDVLLVVAPDPAPAGV